MRVPGYCTECRKFKQVRVSGHALVMAQARGRGLIPDGICAQCEDEKLPGGRRK